MDFNLATSTFFFRSSSRRIKNRKIESIEFEESTKLESIGSSAFENTLITKVALPNSVTRIGDKAFYNAPIKSISLSNSLKTIGTSAFENTELTSITLPSSLTTIGTSAFSNTKITSVTLPNNVDSIGSSAFANNKKLTSVTLSNSLNKIGSSAFANTGITSITIPSSLTDLGASVFEGTAVGNNYEANILQVKSQSLLTGANSNEVWCKALFGEESGCTYEKMVLEDDDEYSNYTIYKCSYGSNTKYITYKGGE